MPVSEAAKKNLRDTLDLNKDSLFRRNEWGTYNFEDVAAEINIILVILEQINALPDELVTSALTNDINYGTQLASAALKRLASFDIRSSGDVEGQRKSIAQSVREAANHLEGTVAPKIAFHANQMGIEKIKSLEESARNQLMKIVGDAQRQLETAEKAAADAGTAASAAAMAAAKTGVSVHAAAFETEAKSLAKKSIAWVCASAFFGILACGAAWYFYEIATTGGIDAVLVQRGVSKLFVLGALTTAMLWCAGNYRTLRHQVTTNRHRMLALQTFNAFVVAADDAPTKSAILLETTRSIYAAAPTGYLNATETNAEGGTRALDAASRALR